MDFRDYQYFGDSGESFWWFTGKRNLTLNLVQTLTEKLPSPPTILDFGCGRGEMVHHLNKIGNTVGVDNSPELTTVNGSRKKLVRCDGRSLCFRQSTFDLITMLDALEHFEDDLPPLSQAYEKLKAGGHLLISVPAVPMIYGPHDRELKHFRRYSRKNLLDLINKTDFKVVTVTYWNFFLFVPIFLIRWIERLKDQKSKGSLNPPPAINKVLTRILNLENHLIQHNFRFPFGISLLAILKK